MSPVCCVADVSGSDSQDLVRRGGLVLLQAIEKTKVIHVRKCSKGQKRQKNQSKSHFQSNGTFQTLNACDPGLRSVREVPLRRQVHALSSRCDPILSPIWKAFNSRRLTSLHLISRSTTLLSRPCFRCCKNRRTELAIQRIVKLCTGIGELVPRKVLPGKEHLTIGQNRRRRITSNSRGLCDPIECFCRRMVQFRQIIRIALILQRVQNVSVTEEARRSETAFKLRISIPGRETVPVAGSYNSACSRSSLSRCSRSSLSRRL